MATVNIVLSKCEGRSVGGEEMPVMAARSIADKTISSSSSTQTGGITATGGDQMWRIVASGNDVYVRFGDSPEAASGAGWLLKDGVPETFSAEADQQVAFIDAA